MGIGDFNHSTFKIPFDSDAVIQALTHRFDVNGIELVTKAMKDKETRAVEKEKSADVVKQMAKSATKRAMADR